MSITLNYIYIVILWYIIDISHYFQWSLDVWLVSSKWSWKILKTPPGCQDSWSRWPCTREPTDWNPILGRQMCGDVFFNIVYVSIQISRYLSIYKYIIYILVGCIPTLLKNMKVNEKDDIPYMKWKIKVMFQTTNQIYMNDSYGSSRTFGRWLLLFFFPWMVSI